MKRRGQRDFSEETPGVAASGTGASEAMEVIARALEPLPPDVRLRVIRATAILLDVDLTGRTSTAPAPNPEPPAEETE